MKLAHIVDTAFSHGVCINSVERPTSMTWIRGFRDNVPVRFFTDRQINSVELHPADAKVALLLEPFPFEPGGYTVCLKKLQQFKYCLSYDTDYLKKMGERGLFFPHGGCWLRNEDIGIHAKSKSISIIASAKTEMPGHKLRHRIVTEFPGQISLFGSGYAPVTNKIDGLKNYMFSFAIENSQIPGYFTEKLIDCFLSGTVPIYWGAPDIGKFFVQEGMLVFQTVDELRAIWDTFTLDTYRGMAPAILENFRRARQYQIVEDWLTATYPFLFP
jgi:hypothetical protein